VKNISYSNALNEALKEEMSRDNNVLQIGEDLGDYGGLFRVTKGHQKEFGKLRVLDTPIAENSIVGLALGAALLGLRPVVEILYIDFITLAMDQIVNQAAKVRYMTGNQFHAPMVIRTQGGTGRRNAAQHSQSLETWFTHVPGLKVVMPSDPADAKGLLKSAVREDDPVIFIEHKNLYFKRGPVPEEEYTIPIGKAEIKREGKDVTIIAYSWMVEKAKQAAAELEEKGISTEIVDLRTLIPLDIELIVQSVQKTGRVVIVHEAVKTSGFGAEIACSIYEHVSEGLKAPIRRVCGVGVPIPYSASLEDASIPQVKNIVDAVQEVL